MPVRVRTRGAPQVVALGGQIGAQHLGGFLVVGVCDRGAGGPDPLVGGHDLLGAGHRDQHRGGDPVDEPADRPGVHRVVVAVDADVVVARHPHPARQPDRRGDRRKIDHRRAVGVPALRGASPDRTQIPAVRDLVEPLPDLGVEVERRREHPPGQERGLEIAVPPLDQALGFRIAGWGELDPDPERPGERRSLAGEPAGAPDRGLPVPDQDTGTASPALQDLPHPGQNVPSLAGRDHHRVRDPGITTGHRQHRQHPSDPASVGAQDMLDGASPSDH